MSRQKTSKRRLETIEKQVTAMRLRAKGLNYERIGAEMGLSRQMAQRHVDNAMKEMKGNIIELAQQEREKQMIQTDLLLEKHFPKAENGDPKSTELCLNILARRAKITGADLPEKIAPTTPDGDKPYDPITDAERIERLAAVFDGARERRDMETRLRAEEGRTGSD